MGSKDGKYSGENEGDCKGRNNIQFTERVKSTITIYCSFLIKCNIILNLFRKKNIIKTNLEGYYGIFNF